MQKLTLFTNRSYHYKTPDDSFVARGLHLNELLTIVNDNLGDNEAPDIQASSSQTISIGNLNTDGAVFIRYYATNGTLAQAGEIKIVNKTTSVSWSLTTVGDAIGVTFLPSLYGDTIFLTIAADASHGTISLSYQKNIIEKQDT